MAKTKPIDRKKLTPVFKKVLKAYFEMVPKKQWAVHDVTARFLNYSITIEQSKATKDSFSIVDFQELIHFIKVAERELEKQRKK